MDIDCVRVMTTTYRGVVGTRGVGESAERSTSTAGRDRRTRAARRTAGLKREVRPQLTNRLTKSISARARELLLLLLPLQPIRRIIMIISLPLLIPERARAYRIIIIIII